MEMKVGSLPPPQRGHWHRRPKTRDKFMIEVFAGSRCMAQAFADEGMPAVSFDAGDCKEEDVLEAELSKYLFYLLRSGRVGFVWLGTPCNTWSRARDIPGGPPASARRSRTRFVWSSGIDSR